MKLRYPVQPVRITQYFAENPKVYEQFGLKGHNGLDFGCTVGTDLMSCADGTITFIGDQGGAGYGKYIRMHTDDGYEITYGHLSQQLVRVGDKVKAGQHIGETGNTGFSTGPHLHLGVRQLTNTGDIANYTNGYKGSVDPNPFFMNTPGPNQPIDAELNAAELWASENKIMGMLNLDQPMLRKDVLRVAYRLFTLLKK